MYKVYLAKLKRTNAKPSCVYKVGITASKDAMDRLMYTGPDEPYPISKYFSDIKIMKTIWVDNKQAALEVEHHLMETIMTKAKSKYFHNWREPDQISGITEMRTWNYDEIQDIIHLMDSHPHKRTIQQLSTLGE